MKRLRFENINLDRVDATILASLASNARLSVAALARDVGLSSPTVADRIRRLEDAGVIRSYTLEIDPAEVGLPVAAWLRIKPIPGQLPKVAKLLARLPNIVECDRITGDDCFLARAHVRSVSDLEGLINTLIPYATTNTSVIQSSPVRRRLPPVTVDSAA